METTCEGTLNVVSLGTAVGQDRKSNNCELYFSREQEDDKYQETQETATKVTEGKKTGRGK